MSKKQQYLSVRQAAAEIGVSDSRVRQLLLSGDMDGIKTNWSWIIHRSEVERVKANKPATGRPRKGVVK